MQDAECNAISKDVLHISDDSDIEIVRELIVVVASDEHELGVTVVPPLGTLNIPKIKRLWRD